MHCTLVLENSQATLDNDVLEDRSRWDVDGAVLSSHNDDSTLEHNATAKVDITGNSEVVKFDNVRNATNPLLELGNLLEVTAELDERSRAKSVGVHDELTMLESVKVGLDEHKVGACLDWQESSTGHVDTVGVLEESDGSTNSRLELQD